MTFRLSKRALATTVTFVAILAMWLFLFRLQFIHGDDYRHVFSAGGGKDGHLTAAQIWNSYWHDWRRVNGRLADTWVRIVVSLGQPAVRIIVPLLLMVYTVTAAWFLPVLRDKWWSFAVRMLVASSVLLVWLMTVPAANGHIIYWVSGFINYVVPLTLMLVAIKLTARSVDGTLSTTSLVTWGLAVVVCALLHEQTAFAMAVLLALRLLWSKFRVAWPVWALGAASVLCFAWVYISPGLRTRSATNTRNMDRYIGTEWWHRFWYPRAISIVAVNYLAIGLGLLVLALAVATWNRYGRRWRIASIVMLASWLVSVLAYHAYAWVNRSRFTYPETVLTAKHLAVIVIALGCCLGSLAIAWALTWKARDQFGTLPFFVVGIGAAVTGLNFLLGLNEGRPWFPSGMLLLLSGAYVALLVLHQWTGTRLGALALAAVLVGGVAVHAVYTVRANAALQKNWKVVGPLLTKLKTAKDKHPAEIELPYRSMPARDYTSGVGFYLQYTERAIRAYYAVPASTKFVQK